MRITVLRRLRLLLAVVASAAVMASCSSSSSSSRDDLETNFGTGDYRLEFEFVIDGRAVSSEVLFDAPESWQVIGDSVIGDVIVVGQQAWKLEYGFWNREMYSRVWSLLQFRVMKQVIPARAVRTGGPVRGGEGTSIWTVEQVPVGSNMALAMRSEAREYPEAAEDLSAMADELDGATATITFIVGDATRKLYEYRFAPDDDRLPKASLIVHYEGVTISPPTLNSPPTR